MDWILDKSDPRSTPKLVFIEIADDQRPIAPHTEYLRWAESRGLHEELSRVEPDRTPVVPCPDPTIHDCLRVPLAFPTANDPDLAWLLLDRKGVEDSIERWLGHHFRVSGAADGQRQLVQRWIDEFLTVVQQAAQNWFQTVLALEPLSRVSPQLRQEFAERLGVSAASLMNLPSIQNEAAAAQQQGDRRARREFGKFSQRRPGRRPADRAGMKTEYKSILRELTSVTSRLRGQPERKQRGIWRRFIEQTPLGCRFVAARVANFKKDDGTISTALELAAALFSVEFKVARSTALDALKRKAPAAGRRRRRRPVVR